METNYLALEARSVGVLQSRLGENIIINHPVGYQPQILVQSGLVDCVIVDTEIGFSQLGMMQKFLSAELGLTGRDFIEYVLDDFLKNPEKYISCHASLDELGLTERNLVKHVLYDFPNDLKKNISSLARWNRSRNPEVTLVAIPSERPGSYLKGLILSPYDGSKCYKKYSVPEYSKAHRDFMYNVTYEAISYAYKTWGARRIGITHFSRSKYGNNGEDYRRDLTTCQVEAMAHFCNIHKCVECFTFIDESDGNHPLEVVKEFNETQDIGVHRTINTKTTKFCGIDFIDLDWITAP